MHNQQYLIENMRRDSAREILCGNLRDKARKGDISAINRVLPLLTPRAQGTFLELLKIPPENVILNEAGFWEVV